MAKAKVMAKANGTTFVGVSDQNNRTIALMEPYKATIEIVGTAKLLFHCWNSAPPVTKVKGGASKTYDDLESYVMRDEKGRIVIPTVNFCASIREAGKSYPDPASPRKSMRDRLNAIVVPFNEYGVMVSVDPKNTKHWDFVDSRRACIQRAGITRQRPGLFEGWKTTFEVMVLAPDYLQPEKLHEIIESAGKFQAIGDFRPSHGRYRVTSFQISKI